jgi:ribosomal protein S21
MLVTITKPNPTNKDLDIAIKKLNKMVKDSNILEELKKREVYYKPSLKAKMKRNEARKRRIRDQKKLEKRNRRRLNKDFSEE